MKFDLRRVRKLNQISQKSKRVVYWMSRDQRIEDNWALWYGLQQASALNQQLEIVFVLVKKFEGATLRQYQFMIDGLQILSSQANSLGIPFTIEFGLPSDVFKRLHAVDSIGLLVTDFSPLKIARQWKQTAACLPIALHEVDAHNIIPPWVISTKQEYSARTIRSKIQRLLPDWLVEFPKIPVQQASLTKSPLIDWPKVRRSFVVDTSVTPITWLQAGIDAAENQLSDFVANGLEQYSNKRNDPGCDGLSNLSPYLHFGQLSAQRVALRIRNSRHAYSSSAEKFLEELIVRRELAENFCFYNQNYDSTASYPGWALHTLREHEQDERLHLYTQEQLEMAQTSDPLWNLAQQELRLFGKMHGYMRMYWAKQLLRWTKSVEEAQKIALYLNDRYELDGRDPNGYVGIAWSLGGVHDRPWPAQPIFGKVRSMSYESTGKKFNQASYEKRIKDFI